VDSTTTTNWSATSGGAGGVSAPVAGDNITFDGSSGGGVVTPNSSIDSIAFGTLTASAFIGTLAFNTNNPNMSFAGVNVSGTATCTTNLGSGTWTLTSGGVVWDCTNSTGLTPTFQNAALSFPSLSGTQRIFNGGAKTYGAVTIADQSSAVALFTFGQSNTFASMTVVAGQRLTLLRFKIRRLPEHLLSQVPPAFRHL
jgi:hypothetical protein